MANEFSRIWLTISIFILFVSACTVAQKQQGKRRGKLSGEPWNEEQRVYALLSSIVQVTNDQMKEDYFKDKWLSGLGKLGIVE